MLSEQELADDGEGEGSEAGQQDGPDGDDDSEMSEEYDMSVRVGSLTRQELAAHSPAEQLAKWCELQLPLEADIISELDARLLEHQG